MINEETVPIYYAETQIFKIPYTLIKKLEKPKKFIAFLFGKKYSAGVGACYLTLAEVKNLQWEQNTKNGSWSVWVVGKKGSKISNIKDINAFETSKRIAIGK